MAKITIYGASDDLIEIEGAISEELNVYDSGFLHFNEGTVVSVVYDEEGLWKLSVVKQGTAAVVAHTFATDEEDDYSDKLILEGEISRVDFWEKVDGPTEKELRKKVEDMLEDIYLNDAPFPAVKKLYDILREIQ